MANTNAMHVPGPQQLRTLLLNLLLKQATNKLGMKHNLFDADKCNNNNKLVTWGPIYKES